MLGDIFPHHWITFWFHWDSPTRHYLRVCRLKDNSHKHQTCFSEVIHGASMPTLQRGSPSRASPTVDISLSSAAATAMAHPRPDQWPQLKGDQRAACRSAFAQGQYHRVTHSQRIWTRRVSFLSLPTVSLKPFPHLLPACLCVTEATFPIPSPEASSGISRTLLV